jgi:MFS family permease
VRWAVLEMMKQREGDYGPLEDDIKAKARPNHCLNDDKSPSRGLTTPVHPCSCSVQVSMMAIVGAMTGQLVFGALGDRFGRKSTFLATAVLVIFGTIGTALVQVGPRTVAVCGRIVGGQKARGSSAFSSFVRGRKRGFIGFSYFVGVRVCVT